MSITAKTEEVARATREIEFFHDTWAAFGVCAGPPLPDFGAVYVEGAECVIEVLTVIY